jgi:hypothetical protein
MALFACCACLLLWTLGAVAQEAVQEPAQESAQKPAPDTKQGPSQSANQGAAQGAAQGLTQASQPQTEPEPNNAAPQADTQAGAQGSARQPVPQPPKESAVDAARPADQAADRPPGAADATRPTGNNKPAAAAEPASIAFRAPKIVVLAADWTAARAAATALLPAAPADQTTADPLPRLNAAAEKFFAKIANSPVPVLLPFDIAAYLADQSASPGTDKAEPPADSAAKYLSGFAIAAFLVGPGGYDAVFTLSRDEANKMGLAYREPIDVQLSGLAAAYELDGTAIADEAVPQLAADFPGIRRSIADSEVRYSFERFGIPYVASMQCHDTARRALKLACREADQVALRFLKSLKLGGGAPPNALVTPDLALNNRPQQTSPDFTYIAPGNLLPGTGMTGHAGRPDPTVYAGIRFPIAQAPAYVNSQAFMNWGNCDLTGRISLGGRGKDAAYRCRVNNVPLINDEAKNYAYPWRDNFCEHRYFPVGQCPAGLGHQGEDIRPGSCNMRNPDAGRCQPYQHDIVAVADGVVQRLPGAEALRIIIDRPGAHIRARYLHMSPKLLDAAGLTDGRQVHEGDSLGQVGDYGQHEGGTSYHLHFDLQVATRHGWQYVNPYFTLVSAYERLIGARGRLIEDNLPADAAAVPETPKAVLATPHLILGHKYRSVRGTDHLSYHHRFFRLRHGRATGRYSKL